MPFPPSWKGVLVKDAKNDARFSKLQSLIHQSLIESIAPSFNIRDVVTDEWLSIELGMTAENIAARLRAAFNSGEIKLK